MNDLDQVLRTGTLLIIETGAYSDSHWCGPVRVLRDFSKREAADAFHAAFTPNPDYSEWGPFPSDFLPWLVTNGYVEDVGNCTSWHVGSDGEFTP